LTFVAKRELLDRPVLSFTLRRLGVEFVERWDMQGGTAYVDQVSQDLRSGATVVFFPEGTFDRMPGLLPFHLGAFVAAAAAGAPVVPVAIRGTRSILRAWQWLPRRGGIQVTASPAVLPDGDDWPAAVRLRDTVREQILATCGEPDLAGEREAAWRAARGT